MNNYSVKLIHSAGAYKSKNNYFIILLRYQDMYMYRAYVFMLFGIKYYKCIIFVLITTKIIIMYSNVDITLTIYTQYAHTCYSYIIHIFVYILY